MRCDVLVLKGFLDDIQSLLDKLIICVKNKLQVVKVTSLNHYLTSSRCKRLHEKYHSNIQRYRMITSIQFGGWLHNDQILEFVYNKLLIMM